MFSVCDSSACGGEVAGVAPAVTEGGQHCPLAVLDLEPDFFRSCSVGYIKHAGRYHCIHAWVAILMTLQADF